MCKDLYGSLILPTILYQLIQNTIYIHCLYNIKNDVLRETTRIEPKNEVLLGKPL